MDKVSSAKLNNYKIKALYSPIYIMLISLITLLSWAYQQSAVGMAILLLIAGVSLIINRDVLPVMPCFIYCIYCTAKSDIMEDKSSMRILIIACIILVIAIIVHLIKYKPKFRLFKLTVPLTLVSVALAIGGVGVIKWEAYFNSLTFILSLGLLMLVLYYFCMLYICPDSTVNAKKYVCYIIAGLGLTVLFQLFIAISRDYDSLIEAMRAVINVGWGNRNSIAMTLNICFPIMFYLAYCNKRLSILYYLIGILEYLALMFIFSRGAMVAATVTMFIIVIYTLAKGINRSRLILAISLTCIIIAISAMILPDFYIDIWNQAMKIIKEGTSSGRDALYREAYRLFLEHPLFGAGVGYIGTSFNIPPHSMYWFHNTIFQIIGNMGMVGIIAYGIFYVVRGVIMFTHLKHFNLLISFAIISFEMHSMVDTGTFTPFPYMFIIIFLTAFLEYNNEHEDSYLSNVALQTV